MSCRLNGSIMRSDIRDHGDRRGSDDRRRRNDRGSKLLKCLRLG
jgi:hypothetical protein